VPITTKIDLELYRVKIQEKIQRLPLCVVLTGMVVKGNVWTTRPYLRTKTNGGLSLSVKEEREKKIRRKY